jgi:vancomycin resistance protein VanW
MKTTSLFCFSHHTPLYRQLKNVDLYLQQNKVINLKLVAKQPDGLVLNPGEILSYFMMYAPFLEPGK